MRIAIISDSHENKLNLEKVLTWLNDQEIKLLIHCGDVSRVAMLEILQNKFFGKIHLVWGNADEGYFDRIDYDDYDKIKFYDKIGKLKVKNTKIAWTHFPKVAKELGMGGDFDLVFYGHTHKPWSTFVSHSSNVVVKHNKTTEDKEEKIGLARVVNPGNLAGVRYRASFAVYDSETDEVMLKILDQMK